MFTNDRRMQLLVIANDQQGGNKLSWFKFPTEIKEMILDDVLNTWVSMLDCWVYHTDAQGFQLGLGRIFAEIHDWTDLFFKDLLRSLQGILPRVAKEASNHVRKIEQLRADHEYNLMCDRKLWLLQLQNLLAFWTGLGDRDLPQPQATEPGYGCLVVSYNSMLMRPVY